MFLKEKFDRTVKGRACTDGQKQQGGSQTKDATPPTVALESVLITSAIETHKIRDSAVLGIPGSFLTTDMEEYVIMVLKGRLVELILNTKPRIYQKFVRIENGQTILNIKLQKAIYG